MLARTGDAAVIGVNSRHHRNRQRFTIAHEIAHLILHDFEVHIDRDFRAGTRWLVRSDTDVAEVEANLLAVELLIPYAMLLADLGDAGMDFEQHADVGPLAKRYGVSQQTMMHRLVRMQEF